MAKGFETSELFRYVKIEPVSIVDLEMRARADPFLADLMTRDIGAQRDWAVSFLKSSGAAEEAHEHAPEECLKRVLAYKMLGEEEAADAACCMLLREELGEGPQAELIKPVLKRFAPKPVVARQPEDDVSEAHETEAGEGAEALPVELETLRENIARLWRARNIEMKALRSEIADTRREVMRDKTRHTGAEEDKEARKAHYDSELKARLAAARDLAGQLRGLEEEDEIAALAQPVEGETAAADLASLKATVHAGLVQHGIHARTFAEAYETVARRLDARGATAGKPVGKPDVSAVRSGCFEENPKISFATQIAPVGVGKLVKVEETFLRYTEGEINYVENILAGEVRSREVKDTKYFEQLSEDQSEVVSETSEETSAKTASDLRSQVETELATRFNTDVNATASGSGGGSIGVVDFDGSAALNAGFGIGVDTSLSTATENQFSQEILSKSIENTRKTTLSRRLNRSYSLYETTNLHKIDNTVGDEIKHRRGVYCFLDKHICISEKTYDSRVFLLANVMLPGKNLICEQKERRRLEMEDASEPPVFNIGPQDITPKNYLELAGRFNASNIQPPPDPVVKLARTYKTDNTNVQMEQGGGFDLKKMADVLVPFFEKYQRNMIGDTIKLPDGYEVQDIWVSVNHGANGISVPAHLPLTAGGAAIYSMPLLAYSALMPLIYLPITVWQIAYLSSPLLHYNADSSNVTVCVGTESQDSPYYFFEPDFLVAELFDLLGNFTALAPGVLETIRSEADALFTNLTSNANALPPEMANLVKDALDAIVAKVNAAFTAVIQALDPTIGEAVPTPGGELKAIGDAMADLAASITVESTNLQTAMGTLFDPIKAFFDTILLEISEAIGASISEFFTLLLSQFENSQKLQFTEAYGTRKELPVSINAISIQPGITMNLVVSLRRTDEALDKWRLETFGGLYQAHLQQVAEYESRQFGLSPPERLSKSPGTMRAEEHLALKEILLNALNNYHPDTPGGQYSLQRINLFEHAVDWENISYKLFNYGPNPVILELEKQGFFKGFDGRRRAFMTAHWAQVAIPLKPDDHMVSRMLAYFDTGEANLNTGLQSDELVALYQALIQDRALREETPEVKYRTEILPTDLVVLKLDDTLPENPNTGCPL